MKSGENDQGAGCPGKRQADHESASLSITAAPVWPTTSAQPASSFAASFRAPQPASYKSSLRAPYWQGRTRQVNWNSGLANRRYRCNKFGRLCLAGTQRADSDAIPVTYRQGCHVGQNRPTIQIMEPYRPSDTLPVLSHDKCPHAHAISVSQLSGPDAGLYRTFPLSTVQVGRATTADLVLRDPIVSMFHLELSPYRSGSPFCRPTQSQRNFDLGHFGRRNRTFRLQTPAQTTEIRVELEQPFPIPTASVDRFGKLIGASLPMPSCMRSSRGFAPTPLSVLIQGETGVGKELIAHALHANSPRTKHQFVVLDCSTMQPELAASKLFGHEKVPSPERQKRMGVFECDPRNRISRRDRRAR